MNPYSEIAKTFSVQKGIKIYDFATCIMVLQTLGKFYFGKQFTLHQEDLPVIKKLLVYSIKDQESSKILNLDLNKGLLLSGPVGCGKTSLMYLLNFFAPRGSEYKLKPCREIAFDFSSKGYEAINPFTKIDHKQTKLSAYCFDDLGTEKQIKHFGNECNVMAEIILSRYDSYIHQKSITHLTTNLSASELENLYGDRVRSRMRQMFNLVAFAPNSADKRQ